MKEIGLLIYMMGLLLIASPKRFGFKEDVYPSYHHEVFDRDSLREKLLKLEKEMAFGLISKKNDEGSLTVTKPKRNLKYTMRVKMLEMKYALKPMPNYRTHEEVNAYIRKRTMNILNKYYNMEESDFHVNFEGRIKMIGEKKVVAADWVYKKYGILNPRPTFTRVKNEMGDEIYRIECHPDWEDDVIFAPLDFTNITVKLKTPLTIKMVNLVVMGSVAAFLFLVSLGTISPMVFLMAKRGPVRYDDFTEILNVTDYGIIGDGAVDETNALESLFTTYNGRVLFFPRGTYDVDQYGSRTTGAYSDVMGPGILADTTIVGEGAGTEFVALANALYMFYLAAYNNITIKDCKFTGTGIAGAGNLSSGAIYGQNCDNLHIINVTSNAMIGGGGLNSRGLSIVGTQIGSLVQDCRMDGNQHGIVTGAPNPPQGVRIVSCFSNDATERHYYFEGEQAGIVMISTVAEGTGGGCYPYYSTAHKGTSFIGNTFLCDGIGIEPYQPGAYQHSNVVWSENIAQTGSYGMYPQCSRTVFKGNIITFNTSQGMYSFTRFTYNRVESNIFSRNSGNAIHLNNDSDDNNFFNNEIIDNPGGGWWIQSGDNNRLIGNRIYSSDTGTYHTSTGITISGDYTYLKDNDFRSAGATVINDAVTTTIWAGGNLTMALA